MAVAPFLIMFREGLEAALIIAIIIAYLTKTGRLDLRKYVWFGTGAAILLSLVIGVIVFVVYGALSGVIEKLFEGLASLFATVVLTTMIFWMIKNAKNIKGELHRKLDSVINRKYVLGVAVIAFIAVFREGIETVLFLAALVSIDPSGVVIGSSIGFLTAILFAFLLLKGTVRLPIQKFFKYTSVILIVFAAGLFGYGIHELIEAGELMGQDFGFFGEKAYDINPTEETNLLHEKGAIGSIFKSLVGYDGNPEWLRVFGYIGYWLIIGSWVLISFRRLQIPTINTKIKPELNLPQNQE